MAGFVTNNDKVDPVSIFNKHLTRLTALRGDRQAQTAYITSVSPPEPVVKSTVEKHEETLQTVERRVNAVMKMAAALDLHDAHRQVFQADEALYNRWRQATYVRGPLPQAPPDSLAKAAPPNDAYAQAQTIAKALKDGDVYGQYRDKSELEMIGIVWTQQPDLYEKHRRESVYKR